MLKIQASTGGVDIIAGIIQKFNPYISIERIISIICCFISIMSYFVYKNYLSVILSFTQMFVFDKSAEYILKDTRHAVEFKIITQFPQVLEKKILDEIKHGATLIKSKGVFSGNDSYMIVTVVNIRQIPDLMNIIKSDKTAFVYYTEAKGVTGNFRWKKEDEVK